MFLEFIPWGHRMSVPNFLAVHSKVQIFQQKSKKFNLMVAQIKMTILRLPASYGIEYSARLNEDGKEKIIERI